ncbi:MAG TPA: hypothetical protein VLI04_20560 [Nocardioidaceae bacterium]|nr:hypothetical protein [Nocardioidaceae bacterium]
MLSPRLSQRQTLQLDAVASGGLGLLLAVLAPLADDQLGLPTGLSIGLGIFLVAWAAFVGWASTRDSAALTKEIALLNVGWVVASLVFIAAQVVDLTGLGVGFVVLQALAVTGFVVLQWTGVSKPVTA